jgi:hypothetical protein
MIVTGRQRCEVGSVSAAIWCIVCRPSFSAMLQTTSRQAAALAIKHVANYIYTRNKRWVPFADYWLAIPLRDFLPTGSVRGELERKKAQTVFYKEALGNFETFIDRGGTLADSTTMVRTAYRSFLATIVTPPKAITYAPTDRFAVWRRLRAKHFAPNARNLLWQISHNILPIKPFLKERNVTKKDICEVCKSQVESLQHRFFDIPTLKKFDLIQIMDLDFGLPPSLQRGAEILFSEGLYTFWTARNEVTFGRRQHDGLSVRELAIRRIKVRRKAELRLHGIQQFTDQWPQGWWWRIHQNDVSFLF